MTAQRRTLLVVEDSLSLRAMLLRILGRTYDVSTADDGETALQRFNQGQRFDVVLCDLDMPRMDGAVLLEQLRRLDADQASRVIVLTGHAEAPLATRVAGHHVFAKPFDVAKLRELVDRVSGAARDGHFPSVAVIAAQSRSSSPVSNGG
jgi:CheY-like chemotaxis protein